jgi:hypothetical protein
VPRCAPSLAIFAIQQIRGLRSLIDRGYVVTATDYPGLGTPGPHPYLVGESEARAVIDSVRAARTLPGAGKGNRFIAWGHSQGGQAALFTGMIAKSYAPELALLGVATAAPATDLATLMTDDIDTVGGKNITAMTLWSWQRVYGAAMNKAVDRRAMPTIDQLAAECIEGPLDLVVQLRTEKPLEQYFLTAKDPADIEPWRSLLVKNTPGALPSEIPGGKRYPRNEKARASALSSRRELSALNLFDHSAATLSCLGRTKARRTRCVANSRPVDWVGLGASSDVLFIDMHRRPADGARSIVEERLSLSRIHLTE